MAAVLTPPPLAAATAAVCLPVLSIAPRIRAYFFRYGRQSDLMRIAREHDEVLSALRSDDHKNLMRVVERHIAVRAPRLPDD